MKELLIETRPFTYTTPSISLVEGFFHQVEKFKARPTYILKSTVLPGTTNRLIEKFNLDMVFCPEFLTEKTAKLDMLTQSRIVLGGDPKLTKQVKDLFEYKDGNLYWKIRPANRVQIGDKVGSINSAGYLITRINNKQYQNHRIIFLYYHGYLPQFIDHKDCNPLNNRLENLREATASQNTHNYVRKKKSNTGVCNVAFNKKTKKRPSLVA
jgi:hypothetical protein